MVFFYINAYNILVLVGIAGYAVATLYKYMWTYCDAPGFQLPSLTLMTGSAGSNQSNPGQT
jgi:hypothetical protein